MDNLAQLSKICRTCMAQEEIQFSLFEPWYQDDSVTFSQMLKCCTKIEVRQTDIISTKVCQSCLSMLEQLYTFRQKCRETDNYLHSKLNELLQTESIEIKDDDQNQQILNKQAQIYIINPINTQNDQNVALQVYAADPYSLPKELYQNGLQGISFVTDTNEVLLNNSVKKIDENVNKINLVVDNSGAIKEEQIINYGSVFIRRDNEENHNQHNQPQQIEQVGEVIEIEEDTEDEQINTNDNTNLTDFNNRIVPMETMDESQNVSIQIEKPSTTLISTPSGGQSTRKKKICLPIRTKLEMIEEVESGCSVKEVAEKYGIVTFTLKQLLKKKDKLRELAKSCILSSDRKYF